MRIRSVKPEFWRSEDIAHLPKDVRLLFIGLWSYVDDNGVGVDDYRRIAADLFALDDNPLEARECVREGLATLSRALLIARYEVSGKRYLFVRTWDKHQKVDRPGKPRYPRPSDDLTSDDTPDGGLFEAPSGDTRESLATGAGEQRSRGTETNPSGLSGDADASPPPGPKTKRATRIPDDFSIPAALQQWAREECPDVDGKYETAQFIDYWRGRGGKEAMKVDWIATWRKWMRKGQKDIEEGSKPRRPQQVNGTNGAQAAPTGSSRVNTALGFLAPDDPLRAQLGLPVGQNHLHAIEGGLSA